MGVVTVEVEPDMNLVTFEDEPHMGLVTQTCTVMAASRHKMSTVYW